jgi:hypothetical protein
MYSNLAQRAAPTAMHTMSEGLDRFLVGIVPTLATFPPLIDKLTVG